MGYYSEVNVKLKVFGLDVKLVFRPIMDTMNLHGYFDPVKLEIVIDSKQSKKDQMSTLIHEICHTLAYRLGWKQSISQQMEEMLCEQISTVLMENFDLRLRSKE
jgi:hypothetical protein